MQDIGNLYRSSISWTKDIPKWVKENYDYALIGFGATISGIPGVYYLVNAITNDSSMKPGLPFYVAGFILLFSGSMLYNRRVHSKEPKYSNEVERFAEIAERGVSKSGIRSFTMNSIYKAFADEGFSKEKADEALKALALSMFK